MRNGVRVALFIVAAALAPCCLAQPTGCSVLPPNVTDGTFEAGTPWPGWTVQSSTNFGTPMCDIAGCGTGGGAAAPFAGSNWAWFGGISAAETATTGQSFAISAGAFRFVRFQLRIGTVNTPFTDTLVVSMDASPLVTFTEPAVAEPGYTLRYVDVSAFANGAAHSLLFTYTHPGTGTSNFTVDDVELVACTTPVALEQFRAE
jgi:hypothetical protein